MNTAQPLQQKEIKYSRNAALYENARLFVIQQNSLEYKAEACNYSLPKRIFDILFAGFLFITIFSWLFPLIIFLIKMESKGPVFFIQFRTGLNGEQIPVYKFRSMVDKAPHADPYGNFLQAVKNDFRITKMGKILRKTSLDELPQFINVLIGNMSIVGPRPHVKNLDEQYADIVEGYHLRMLVKPGITGLAQAKGSRGSTEHISKMQQRIDLDVDYIDKWSFLLDIKIIWWTVLQMLKDENAY